MGIKRINLSVFLSFVFSATTAAFNGPLKNIPTLSPSMFPRASKRKVELNPIFRFSVLLKLQFKTSFPCAAFSESSVDIVSFSLSILNVIFLFFLIDQLDRLHLIFKVKN